MSSLITISFLLSILVCASFAELSCGVFEEEDKCPRACSIDTCPKDALHDQPCPRPKECPPPACKCAFNYRRAENGTCIHTESCPPFSCPGVNEVYDSCPPYCPSDDCSDSSPSGDCPLPLRLTRECYPACRCIKGFWRKDGVCVPFKECPPNDNEKLIKLLEGSL